MVVYMGGHYSNDFTEQLVLERLMKVHLVNASLTAGGVIPDCLKAIINGTKPKDINREAMKVFFCCDNNATYTGGRYMSRYLAPYVKDEPQLREALNAYLDKTSNNEVRRDLMNILSCGGDPSSFFERIMKIYLSGGYRETSRLIGEKE